MSSICLRMPWKFCRMPNGIISLANQSYIHTTCGSNGSRQMGNAMRKILGVNKKKKFIYDGIPTISPESFSKGSAEGRLSFNSRRATVLNKLFMKYITDLMATGQYAPLILGHGIEINRVRITPDYKCLNVYWVARGSQDDKAIDDILHKNAGFLRHELSQLRVMGNVPIIQFVKDKQYAHMMALDHRLAIADYGEDHIPSDYTLKLKSELEIFAPLEEDIKKRISEMDEKNPTDDSEELPLPTMPQNVLGLDHAAIMNRIKKVVKKSETVHRHSNTTDEANESWVTFKLNQPINNEPATLGNSKEQREAFREFLQNRQTRPLPFAIKEKMEKELRRLCTMGVIKHIDYLVWGIPIVPIMKKDGSVRDIKVLKMKAKREQKNYIPDSEYLKEELRNSYLTNLNKFDIISSQEEDYIIEDDK